MTHDPEGTGCAPDAPEHESAITALAWYCGANLRLDRDPAAPQLWAVWEDLGDGDEDILGAGDSPSEAIEAARATVVARECRQ